MAVWQSQIDATEEDFEANRAEMMALIERFRALEQKVRAGG